MCTNYAHALIILPATFKSLNNDVDVCRSREKDTLAIPRALDLVVSTLAEVGYGDLFREIAVRLCIAPSTYTACGIFKVPFNCVGVSVRNG